MPTDDELLTVLGAALEPAPRDPPTAAVQALREAAEAARTPLTGPLPMRAKPRRLAAAAVAVAAAIAGFAGAQVIDQLQAGEPGVQEFATQMRSDDGSRQAEAVGTRVGEGRTISLRSKDLPILPKGEFYEVWFVAPGDAPGAPNRISAGTFHPDEQGHTNIVLFGAVDPKKLPVLEITAEPGDGNPLPSGPAVLRTHLVIKG